MGGNGSVDFFRSGEGTGLSLFRFEFLVTLRSIA